MSRDGKPARYDPVLKAGGKLPAAPPLRYAAPPGGGGLRHPKLWLSSNQAAYSGDPLKMQYQPTMPQAPEGYMHGRGGAFTRGFAPPAHGMGMNH